jgi:hypothetical protein
MSQTFKKQLSSINMISEDLAYWIGVAQTDGYFKKQNYKKKQIIRYYICLSVAESSIEMLEKFKKVSKEIFYLKGSLWKNHKRNLTTYKFGCKNLLHLFKSLDIDFNDPPKPPSWIIEEEKYFGAYLAGIIDGDGNVEVKRPQYPQCMIRIYSSCKQEELIKSIKDHLTCSVYQHIITK